MSNQPVHFYDTTKHSVPCGAPAFEQPSTKHVRSVTCPACVAFLAARHVREDAAGDAAHAL